MTGARGIRTRLVVATIGLITLSTALSTFALVEVLLARVDDRIEAALRQEVTEFRGFASGSDVRRTFDRFLARDVPDEGEATFTFLDGGAYRSNADIGENRRLLDVIRRVGDVATTTSGEVRTADGTYRYLAVPVVAGGQRRGAFVTTANLGSERAQVNDAVGAAIGVALAAVALGSVLAWFVAGRMLGPLRRLTDTAATISDTDLTRRLAVSGSDEIATLGRTFNAMLDRLEEAFTTQRAFVSDASHELRTPITIIRGHLELLEGADRATIALVTDELDRMGRFVEDLLTLARAEQGPDFLHPEPIDLDQFTEDLLAKARALGAVALEETGYGVFDGDRQRLTQAMMNLAANAVAHTPPDTVVRLGSRMGDGSVRLWVADDGPGIPDDERRHVFERFARGAAGARRTDGAGLGLAITRAIAEAHGGSVRLDGPPGATFTLELPA